MVDAELTIFPRMSAPDAVPGYPQNQDFRPRMVIFAGKREARVDRQDRNEAGAEDGA
jgi:hypothetical protein